MTMNDFNLNPMEAWLNSDGDAKSAHQAMEGLTQLHNLQEKLPVEPKNAVRTVREQKVLDKADLADIIEIQVKAALDDFKTTYNQKNPGGYLDFLVAFGGGRTVSGQPKRSLEISMVKDGEATIMYRKGYSFQHETQIDNEGEWKLTLWKDALQAIIAGGVLYSMAVQEARKQNTDTHDQ